MSAVVRERKGRLVTMGWRIGSAFRRCTWRVWRDERNRPTLRRLRDASRWGLGFALVCCFSAGVAAQSPASKLDEAFDRYWRADSVAKRMQASESIVKLSSDVAEIERRLRAGRNYSNEVKRGRFRFHLKGSDGHLHHTLVSVPEDYEAAKPIAIRVFLHGGVARPKPWGRNDDWWRRLEPFENQAYIAVFPSSWNGSLWWSHSQVENFQAIVSELKREYNVDENRLFLFGVSDGGTGAYYHAMKAPTLWAAMLPFIGHPAVLANPASGVTDPMYAANVAATPLYIVNGKTDRLYPSARLTPVVESFRELGARLVFKQMDSGHTTRWWPEETASIDEFLGDNARKPFPDRLVWQTDRDERFNRVHWLVVDAVDPKGKPVPEDTLFFDDTPSGRLEVTQKENRVAVNAQGIRRYRLLISAPPFQLDEPVVVITNGRLSFEGRVEPDAKTLLDWASRDEDRSRLVLAEISVDVGLEP